MQAYAVTGDVGLSIKNAGITYASASAFQSVAGSYGKQEWSVGRALKNAGISGATAAAQGGDIGKSIKLSLGVSGLTAACFACKKSDDCTVEVI